jgi:2-hydroxychromene-2-carboxylate isomerase
VAAERVFRTCLAEAGFDPLQADRGLLPVAETCARKRDEAVDKAAFGEPSRAIGGQLLREQDRLEGPDARLAAQS